MRLIDQSHPIHHCCASRRIRDWLEDRGVAVNRKHTQLLTRRMGLVALYPKIDLRHRDHRAATLLTKAQDTRRLLPQSFRQRRRAANPQSRLSHCSNSGINFCLQRHLDVRPTNERFM